MPCLPTILHINRCLAKINYKIHTDAVKEHLIPPYVSKKETSITYASEADVLNVALYGMTAKEWRDRHPTLKGNIRDHSDVTQLVVPQAKRLVKLNRTTSPVY